MVAASKGSTFSYRSHKDPILVIVPTRRSIYIYILIVIALVRVR